VTATGPFLLAVNRDHSWCTHVVEDHHQHDAGEHTWESEIMPTHCQHLCRPTLDGGRRRQSRQVWQITQQPCLVSQLTVGRLLLATVILGRYAELTRFPPFLEMGLLPV